MFTDWAQALEAESFPLDPTSAQQLAAAARVAARHSHDKDDLALLLDVLGLSTDPDTLTALLPLIPETGDARTMTTTSAAPALSAHDAMAISMHTNGDTDQAIREATGLSEPELSTLIADQALGLTRTAADAPAIDVPVIPLPVTSQVQYFLDWAAAHPAAAVRNRAVRITADLAERRDSEAAQREAEEKVARAKAELEREQEELRTVKAGTRTTAAAPPPFRAGAGSGRTREELVAIRAWARENGHQVADAGLVRRSVLEPFDAAHQALVRKAG
ncbi:Lsr2 family DNA-binding protein [Streptomyces griseus]|uniref:Lsr2 family DNA-binding protein n=1 Tax=Streptomyces griseus TaxID=1911 RepID=UPI003811E459